MPPSLPSRPSKDVDKISASWLCKLLDCVAYGMTNPRGDGNTILNQPGGTLRALRQPGGGTDGGNAGVIPAKTVSKSGAFYIVDLYADGFDAPATATNQTAKILMLNYAETLPAGTQVLAALNYVAATGGG